MVFTSLNPARETYRLWHRFHMPMSHGPKDAIAVSQAAGDQLISAYTFILEHIVLLVWGITVLGIILLFSKRYERTHPSSTLNTEIWHNRASPYEILRLMFLYFLKPKSSRWLIVLWLFIALSFLVVKYTVPIIFAPYIKIGSAAPVSPDAIYVPSRNGTLDDPSTLESNLRTLQVFELEVPFALRSAGGVDAANGTIKEHPQVKIDQPEVLGVDQNGEISMRINYGYNVTGVDLGLQNYPELTLLVQGSCMTEYSWWFDAGTKDDLPGAFVEQYSVFNSSLPQFQKFVSRYDGGPPIAYFYIDPPKDDTASNISWAAIISSVNRTSFATGNDPWYRTGDNPIYEADPSPDLGPFMVLPQRPALSCWQDDVWSYKGHSSSVVKLDSIPSLNMPIGLQTILADFLGQPMIVTLGSYLRMTALKSSFTAVSNEFDANSSTIFNDLERLIFASYIATVNVFTETTLFPTGNSIANDIRPDGVLLAGVSDFVVFSNDVVTLSIKSLIVIPTIALTLWVLLIGLMFLPMISQELKVLSHGEKKEEEEEEKEEPAFVEKIASTAVGEILG